MLTSGILFNFTRSFEEEGNYGGEVDKQPPSAITLK